MLVKKGKVAVVPTDTIYGIVASAFDKNAVERVYKLRARDKKKPCIILIRSEKDLKKFSISLNQDQKKFLKKVWPGKVSVVFPCKNKSLSYLHRGKKTLAFRAPKPLWLRRFLRLSGPVIAPSANPQAKPPAKNIKEARRYFGSAVDIFVSGGGSRLGKPSSVVAIKNGEVVVLRRGAVKILKNEKKGKD